VARLLEMGLEPYQITSALFGVLAQRLLRRKGPSGDAAGGDAAASRGRVPVAEIAYADEAARKAILGRTDASSLQDVFSRQAGYRSMRESVEDLVRDGVVDAEEIRRLTGSA
jgi:type II secretory ATPase GspE/PulE/Tfp pilus assembly ATPase PilB-like protein